MKNNSLNDNFQYRFMVENVAWYFTHCDDHSPDCYSRQYAEKNIYKCNPDDLYVQISTATLINFTKLKYVYAVFKNTYKLPISDSAKLKMIDERVNFARFFADCSEWPTDENVLVEWIKKAKIDYLFKFAPAELCSSDKVITAALNRNSLNFEHIPDSLKSKYVEHVAKQIDIDLDFDEQILNLEKNKYRSRQGFYIDGLKIGKGEGKGYSEIQKNILNFLSPKDKVKLANIVKNEEVKRRCYSSDLTPDLILTSLQNGAKLEDFNDLSLSRLSEKDIMKTFKYTGPSILAKRITSGSNMIKCLQNASSKDKSKYLHSFNKFSELSDEDILTIINLALVGDLSSMNLLNTDAILALISKIKTEETMLVIIKKYPTLFRYLSNPNEKVQKLAYKLFRDNAKYLTNQNVILNSVLNNDGLMLQSIDSSQMTEEAILTAINQNADALSLVPTDKLNRKILLSAVNKDGLVLRFIPQNKQTEEIILSAITENALALESVNPINMTHKHIITAIMKNGLALEYVPIDKITEEIIRQAVAQNGKALKFTEQQSPQTQCLAISQNIEAYDDILNPCETAKNILVEKDPNSISKIANPSKELQLKAVKREMSSFYSIQNPDPEVIFYMIDKYQSYLHQIKFFKDQQKFYDKENDKIEIQDSTELEKQIIGCLNTLMSQYVKLNGLLLKNLLDNKTKFILQPNEEIINAAIEQNPRVLEVCNLPESFGRNKQYNKWLSVVTAQINKVEAMKKQCPLLKCINERKENLR